jgi:hypothetical protein
MEGNLAKKKLIKSGDRTIVVGGFNGIEEVKNRLPSQEAHFAMSMIERWAMGVGRNEVLMKPEEAVQRAFYIAELTFQTIKDRGMDTPFPFKKVYLDVDQDR